MTLLDAQRVSSGYGEVRVLHDVSFNVREGGVTAFLGANGAGKSTLFRTVAGLLDIYQGELHFRDKKIDRLEPSERVELGVSMVPEGRLVFPEMTVEQNLRIGAINPRARAYWKLSQETVYEMFPKLGERRGQLAGTLSGGEQQMLALGRGLMAQPTLIMLDEPTLGLAPNVASHIFKIIPNLVELGLTVMIAEQDVNRTLNCADYCYILESGQISVTGTPQELRNSDVLTNAILGSSESQH